ncbi:hypothetical protein PVAG01_05280 [Phlyctema vagabunda]|uniref:Uncharacterized protein n=1 Tax=Phlyctema vagabunda TaxID=108571 RepID=A0ABR4PJZ2_9HELO
MARLASSVKPTLSLLVISALFTLIVVCPLLWGWYPSNFKLSTIRLPYQSTTLQNYLPISSPQEKLQDEQQDDIPLAANPDTQAESSSIIAISPTSHIPSPSTNTASSQQYSSSATKSSSKTQATTLARDLRQLCEQTKWTDGLWIHCHSWSPEDSEGKQSIGGGLNNIRSRLQTCVRVAIDAGGGVIIPSVSVRNETNMRVDSDDGRYPASIFWDMEYMTKVLGEQCPQLKVRFEAKGLKPMLNAPKKSKYKTGTFRKMIYGVLEQHNISIESITPSNPVALTFGDSFTAWNYLVSDELATIRKDLFKTLKYNKDLLAMSSRMLEFPALKKGFIGIHYRAESDWSNNMGNPEHQMKLYIEEMEKLPRDSLKDRRTVYISCGSKPRIQAFRNKLRPLGYQVYDKWSLHANDTERLAKIEGLMFDEKAILEYEMLVNADFFLGVVMSSMSSLIAYARSLDDPELFFPTYVFPGSIQDGGVREYPDAPAMHGNDKSKLMVVARGKDIMAYFP